MAGNISPVKAASTVIFSVCTGSRDLRRPNVKELYSWRSSISVCWPCRRSDFGTSRRIKWRQSHCASPSLTCLHSSAWERSPLRFPVTFWVCLSGQLPTAGGTIGSGRLFSSRPSTPLHGIWRQRPKIRAPVPESCRCMRRICRPAPSLPRMGAGSTQEQRTLSASLDTRDEAGRLQKASWGVA